MHLADRMELPDPYRPRPYLGMADHAAMRDILIAYREHCGDDEQPTAEQFDATYSHLTGCDPATDIAIVEADGVAVGYARASRPGGGDGKTRCFVFAPTDPRHLAQPLFDASVAAQEEHMRQWQVEHGHLQAVARHPGPGLEPTGEAAWLEALGYEAVEWGASLVRPHLEDIPELPLPDGVEVRPVTAGQVRPIWEAHWECFRGEWDFSEATPDEIDLLVDDPIADPSLWKVAWAGDEIVGQVKSFINVEENAARGYRRGYAEYISAHRDWRNLGIAGALLAMSLRELRSRGMVEAALGVDTNNPGGAFHLYTRLGFELRTYSAIYDRAFD